MSEVPIKPFYIIGVCGGSCSGKTTLANFINSSFDEVTTIKQDWYYKGGNSETNFDHPDSIDFEFMIEQINDLLNGKEIMAPIYDFSTHSRKKHEITVIKPSKILVIEGILIFHHTKLNELFNLKIYVDAGLDTRFYRRLERDLFERGRTREEVINSWKKFVKPCHINYVEPSGETAHIRINNDGDKLFDNPSDIVQIKMIQVFIEYKLKHH
jgi:uridine kinase